MIKRTIKNIIKKMVGIENIKKIISYKNYLFSMKFAKNRLNIISNECADIYTIENPNGHVFCGYFDVNPDNPYNGDEILVGMLKKNAKCGKDYLTIAIANYKKNIIKPITKTYAWNWQMGSRLRWSKTPNIIYYNDFSNNKYCCNIYDIEKRRIVKQISYALYDISPDEKFGLSINFSRLQRLRPGYGYSNIEDLTKLENNPLNDGLFLVNIPSGKSELLVSYQQLSDLIDDSKNHQCYINHISISPDGKKAIFFFIWQIDERPGWKATLFVVDIKTKKIKCLEQKDQVSHYDWKDNNNLIITIFSKSLERNFYRMYNCESGTYYELSNKELNKDGHPVFSRNFDGFYSDTYPDKQFKQKFFKYEKNTYIPLLELYHDPRMFGEKRCDLHPHYFQTKEAVALDTTFKKKKRQILVVRMKDE